MYLLNYHLLHVFIPYVVLATIEGKENKIVNVCYNSSLEGFRLNVTVFLTKIVSQRINCIMECSTEPCCRSINYKANTAFENETNCEMLHNLVNNNTQEKLLERNASYYHVFLVNPYKVKYEESLKKALRKSFGSQKARCKRVSVFFVASGMVVEECLHHCFSTIRGIVLLYPSTYNLGREVM